MHIKVNIPPIREEATKDRLMAYGMPPLKMANIFFTIPLDSVMLKENKFRYFYDESPTFDRYSVSSITPQKVERVETRYWIRHPAITSITSDQEWREIHYAEYARISRLIQKLNLLEVDEHNKKVGGVGLSELSEFSEKAIQRSEMNALYGIDIKDEVAELAEIEAQLSTDP